MINSNFEMHFASGHYYDSVDGNKRPVEIQHLCVNGLPVLPNQLLITGVAGKRIRVVGGNAFSNGAATLLAFYSNNAGTLIRMTYLPANAGVPPNVPLVIHETDFFETKTGESLYVTNTAVIALLSINYIIYTPSAT